MKTEKTWAAVDAGAGASGGSFTRPTTQRNRDRRRTGAAIAVVAAIVASGAAAPAHAATPPAFPEGITIFPDRDFVSIDGYQDRIGDVATITVTRGGIVTSSAQGLIAAGSPALEANHPGGVCWGTGAGSPNVTPDLQPGDEVSVGFNGAVADSAVTQSPTVTGVVHTAGSSQVVVNGTLNAPGGPAAIPGNMELRIRALPLGDTTDVGKKDVSAFLGPLTPAATGGYSSSLTTTATSFTATYNFTVASSADLAAAGEMRAMTWMDTDPAGNALGLTISEFGLLGGPGMGGCPQGPSSSAPNAPTNVNAIEGDGSFTATWRAATTIPGGSPVTGYLVEVQDAADPNAPVTQRTAAAGATSLLISPLTNGTAYDIRVIPTSLAGPGGVGFGGPVTPSSLATVAAGVPTIAAAKAGDGSATVNWTRPAGVVSSYTVEVSSGGAVVRTIPSIARTATSTVVTGLTNGTPYTFRVTATNGVGTSAASAASAAVTPGTQVQRYVTQVYSNLFNRTPDPTGLASWTSALSSGTPRVAVANGITFSTEYRSKLITGSYDHYLARTPDPGGLANWLAAMSSGLTISQMESGFIASDEFWNKSGATNEGWVTKLYADVLGRPAGASEVAGWTTNLRNGMRRDQVAMGFLLSTERLSTVVNGHYQLLLGRGIDPSGQATWVGILQRGGRDEAIIGGIIASDEYYGKV